MRAQVTIRCAQHPSYQAKQRPKVDCSGCRNVFHFVSNGGIVFYGINELRTETDYKEWRKTHPGQFWIDGGTG